ncbi:MAG: LLM class flavin-dependent oxidoreductase [Betaproteobacteria bacterium]|nr:LLM class flavin-dependent oxidoreductase [Pseudomonadota bacterium]NBO12467.1 LLM class flavin-dependent oxidoreductase [Betaproteobacteria bacterium]NBO44497.1 LLM class flavin-dependent oxidoreductase [Betaproteobacteria bacterium]NBP10976.1 LLM class flavin-dependent oxidoreductase [Betaproteobacteria bacterium]NBP62898.1 LLM class flavin-dependent oxidoreductase [Betaproteobacteria bacterium]
MAQSLSLSVLDQSIAMANAPQSQAIVNSLDLAQHCESLGFKRFWVSEHHNSDSIVGSAPEVLMAAIAAKTDRIRIGSAGVMLPHYSSLKVAEQFRVLEALAPGRIDLGLGRAPGSDRLTAMALNPYGLGADQFPNQVLDLQAWVSGNALLADHPFASVKAHPQGPGYPEMWILGSSDYGAQLAAYLGLPYAFAYFFSEGTGVELALDLYRRHYRPSERFPEPKATICVWALAADSEAQARHLLKTREHWRVGFEQGRRNPLVSPEEAEKYPYNQAELAAVESVRRKAIVGTPSQVAEKLSKLAEGLGLDEIVINTWAYDHQARKHSYRLIAEAFGH